MVPSKGTHRKILRGLNRDWLGFLVGPTVTDVAQLAMAGLVQQ